MPRKSNNGLAVGLAALALASFAGGGAVSTGAVAPVPVAPVPPLEPSPSTPAAPPSTDVPTSTIIPKLPPPPDDDPSSPYWRQRLYYESVYWMAEPLVESDGIHASRYMIVPAIINTGARTVDEWYTWQRQWAKAAYYYQQTVVMRALTGIDEVLAWLRT